MPKRKKTGSRARDRRRGFTDEDLKAVEFPDILAERLAKMRPVSEAHPHLIERHRRKR